LAEIRLFPIEFTAFVFACRDETHTPAGKQGTEKKEGHRPNRSAHNNNAHGDEPENALDPFEVKLGFAGASSRARHGFRDSLWRA